MTTLAVQWSTILHNRSLEVALGDIGLVLYMFSLGARLDTQVMLHQSRSAIVVSLGGTLLPFIMGAVLAFFLYPSFAGPKASLISFMLLIGTAMAITAFPVLARLLAEKHMLDTKIGMLALTCAALGDAMAWCLLALMIGIIKSKSPTAAVLTVELTLLFVGFLLLVVRPVLAYVDRRIQSKRVLLSLSIVLLLFAAYTTNAIGIHPVFGAFLMGVLLPRRTGFLEQISGVDQINNVLFLPLFFVYSGLRTQIGLLSAPSLWFICLFVVAVACAGKIFGSMFSLRLRKEPWREAFGLGVLMNTRGLVELIVLNIGLDLGVISPTLFAILVIMALVTTMMASPLLYLLGYRQGSGQETILRTIP